MYNSIFFNYVNALNEKYSEVPRFNLFSVLRSDSDEVRLHSRFLAEILNPNGSHGFDFISLFLDVVPGDDIPKSLDIESTEILVEKDNIDIQIVTPDTIIVIENKIFAGDQEQQLARYYNQARSKGKKVCIIYLTLDGRDPSEQSVAGLDKDVICISYKEHVYQWIEQCLFKSLENPAVRESLLQYQDLIKKLTNKVTSVKYMKELKKLLLQDKNLENFLDLQEAFSAAVVDLQVDVWNKVNALLQEKYGEPGKDSILSQEQSKDTLTKFLAGSRNSTYFGVYSSSPYGDEEFSVEMQGNGIIAGVRCEKARYEDRYEEILLSFSEEFGYRKTIWWPCYKYLSPQINYKSLSKENIRFLLDENNRKSIVQEAFDIIEKIDNLLGSKAEK